jgi:hypothetical protein
VAADSKYVYVEVCYIENVAADNKYGYVEVCYIENVAADSKYVYDLIAAMIVFYN